MTTKRKQPKPLHSTTATDLGPKETEATGHVSSVFDQILPSCTDDLTSAIALVRVDASTKTMTLSVANCNLAVVGQPSTVHHYDCHLLRRNRGEGDLSGADCHVEQIQPMDAIADNAVQCFSTQRVSKEENQQKPKTSSGEILVDVEPSIPVIKKQGSLNGPQCEEILKKLEVLQDSGEFERHKRIFDFLLQRCVEKENRDTREIANEQQNLNGEHCNQAIKKFQLFQENGLLEKDEQLSCLCSRLCTKKEDADMELALIIEQGVSFWLHKQLTKSKLYFNTVIKLTEHCQLRNPNILIARAYFLLAANYSSRARKIRKVSSALKCLRRSEALLKDHESPEDWAEMYCILGSVWLAYMSMVPEDDRNAKARNEIQEKAKKYYERAIAICKKDPRSRVQHKKLTYCHLGLAALLLDCTSTVARSQLKVIPSQDLKDARRHLDIVEYELGDVSQGSRVQILKTRSDHYYRQGPEMYQLAKDTAQDALQMARRHEFNTELDSLQEQIDFLGQLCEETVCKERIKLLNDGDTSTSGSDSRFETSCSGSD